MKKLIPLLVIFVFILTGCSSEYNLIVSKNKIKENIKIEILDTDIPKKVPGIDVEVNDRITPFIENDQYPIFNNKEIKYKKTVKKNGNLTTVTLNHTYSHNDFRKSTSFNTCFEKSELNKTRKGFDLKLSGSFYCLYGDSITINIITNNEVFSNNADKVSGNKYTWIINKDNVKDANIDISFSNRSALLRPILYLILGALLVVGSITAYKFYINYKKKDSVNDF